MSQFIPGEYRIFDKEGEIQYDTERISNETEFRNAVDRAVQRLVEDGWDMNNIEIHVERVEVVPVKVKFGVEVTLL